MKLTKQWYIGQEKHRHTKQCIVIKIKMQMIPKNETNSYGAKTRKQNKKQKMQAFNNVQQ